MVGDGNVNGVRRLCDASTPYVKAFSTYRLVFGANGDGIIHRWRAVREDGERTTGARCRPPLFVYVVRMYGHERERVLSV